MSKELVYLSDQDVVQMLYKTKQVHNYIHSEAFKEGLETMFDTAKLPDKGVFIEIDDHILAFSVGAARKYLNSEARNIRLANRELSCTTYENISYDQIIANFDAVIHEMHSGIMYLDPAKIADIQKDIHVHPEVMTVNDFMAESFKANTEKSKNGRVYFGSALKMPNSHLSNIFFEYNEMLGRLEKLSAVMRYLQHKYSDDDLGKTVEKAMDLMAPYVSDYHFDLLGIDAECIRLNHEAGIPMALFSRDGSGLSSGMGTNSASLPSEFWVLEEAKKSKGPIFGLLITPDLNITEIDPSNPEATMAVVSEYNRNHKNSPRAKL